MSFFTEYVTLNHNQALKYINMDTIKHIYLQLSYAMNSYASCGKLCFSNVARNIIIKENSDEAGVDYD